MLLLIPPDCDLGAMSQIAARVVTLGNLRGLTAWPCSCRAPDEGHAPSKH